MIGFLRGTVLDTDLVDVGGVGYSVTTPNLMTAGDEVELWVHTVVREDAFELYGFTSRGERDLFRLLIKVTGVGPRVAVGILTHLGAGPAAAAISAKDAPALAKAKGIGAKTAQNIVNTVAIPPSLLTDLGATAEPEGTDDVITALVTLGWSEPQARAAVDSVRATHGTDLDDAAALRLSMAALAA